MGLRLRKNADRSGLVVLPLLAAKISRSELRREGDGAHPLCNDGLSDCRCRFGGRWLDLGGFDEARLDGQLGAQNRHNTQIVGGLTQLMDNGQIKHGSYHRARDLTLNALLYGRQILSEEDQGV